MKKSVFHLRPGTPIRFENAEGFAELLLDAIDVSESEAYWDVRVTDSSGSRLIQSQHGREERLTKAWRGSYLALTTPIKFHCDNGKNYPDFVALVPDDAEMRVIGEKR